jgi:hypothetical protein
VDIYDTSARDVRFLYVTHLVKLTDDEERAKDG